MSNGLKATETKVDESHLEGTRDRLLRLYIGSRRGNNEEENEASLNLRGFKRDEGYGKAHHSYLYYPRLARIATESAGYAEEGIWGSGALERRPGASRGDGKGQVWHWQGTRPRRMFRLALVIAQNIIGTEWEGVTTVLTSAGPWTTSAKVIWQRRGVRAIVLYGLEVISR